MDFGVLDSSKGWLLLVLLIVEFAGKLCVEAAEAN